MTSRGVLICIFLLLLFFSLLYIAYYAGFGMSKKLKSIPFGQRTYCDASSPCGSGACYIFEGEKKPLCLVGNPCLRCKTKRCTIAESYPSKVTCEENAKLTP